MSAHRFDLRSLLIIVTLCSAPVGIAFTIFAVRGL